MADLSQAPAPRANPADILKSSWTARIGWLTLLAYVLYAFSVLDFSFERFIVGLDNAARLIGRMFPPLFSNA